MNPTRVLPVILLPLLLCGCGGIQGLVPQQSTLQEVRDRMGRPTDIRFDRDGNEVWELWEYARGPVGEETFLIRANKDGRVIEVSQLLTQAQFAKVVPRVSTKAQVRELLGLPSEQHFFRGEAVWSWRMRISPQRGYFAVRFNHDGVAVEAMTLMDPSGDDRTSRDGGRGGGRGGR